MEGVQQVREIVRQFAQKSPKKWGSFPLKHEVVWRQFHKTHEEISRKFPRNFLVEGGQKSDLDSVYLSKTRVLDKSVEQQFV